MENPNPGKVFSSSEIYSRVWHDNAFKAEGTSRPYQAPEGKSWK
jgi:hypothetical protein